MEDKYDQFLDAFQELHEEARKLQYSNNMLKSENKFLEGGLENLDKEKKRFEKLS